MKFQYYKIPLNTRDPISELPHRYCPIMPIEITINGKTAWLDAMVDSGADFNMAPLELGSEVFGLDLNAYPTQSVGGIEQGQGIKLYFASISMRVGGHGIITTMGFGGNLPFALLGQYGFFNQFKKVSFEYPKFFELKLAN